MTLLPIWAEPASQLVWIRVLLPKSCNDLAVGLWCLSSLALGRTRFAELLCPIRPALPAAARAASFSAPRTPIRPLLGVDAAISYISSVPRS